MKSMHFCTPLKIAAVKANKEFWTIRTGWFPQVYQGDLIKINFRTTTKKPHNDKYYCHAECLSTLAIKKKDLFNILEDLSQNLEEYTRYGRKFHKDQYFLILRFKKVEWNVL